MTGSCAALWSQFLASGTPATREADGATYASWQFGYGVEQGDRLLAYVLEGPKRATAGALWTYERTSEPMPAVGEFSVVTDGRGEARCVLRTTSVEIVPFDRVTDVFAFEEGEGDRSLEYWRRVHWDYFTRELAELGLEPSNDMPLVCERFEVVFPVADTGRIRPYALADRGDVQVLIYRSIDACYPPVYSATAVEYFKRYHSLDAICERAERGRTLVAESPEGAIVGTGTLLGREISGVFVAPELQRAGLGSRIMRDLEALARLNNIAEVTLSVSLPSRAFYQHCGYLIGARHSIQLGDGEMLDYWEATKSL